LPPNKSLKPNAYRRNFQPHTASKGFGKCATPCWPGIGLAQGVSQLACYNYHYQSSVYRMFRR